MNSSGLEEKLCKKVNHDVIVNLISACRSADLPTRQRYVALVESVKDNGGIIRIFSSLHLSGEREWLIKDPISLFGFRKTQYIHLTFHLGKLDIPHALVPWPPTQPSRAIRKGGDKPESYR